MYNEYFGFKEAPFSIAPDPRYLYMTAQHREALAHLVYGLNSEGGCILLTGEVGTGKTTICRCLLEQLPEQANVALVLNPKLSEIELLETVCDELHISYPDASNSLKTYTDRIYDFLIESNRKNEKTVLIIDEAQNLDSKVLEQLRLLTNLETDQRKLLQIIILGQPELLDILAKTEMRQLAQRITARFHLQPLSKVEVKAYVSHRLAVAGQNIQLFPENSIKLLYKLSKGVPRLINIICDRALLGAYVENQYSANPAIIKKAATEVFGELKNVEKSQKNKQWLSPLVAFSVIAFIAIMLLYYFTGTAKIADVTQLSALISPEENTPADSENEPLAINQETAGQTLSGGTADEQTVALTNESTDGSGQLPAIDAAKASSTKLQKNESQKNLVQQANTPSKSSTGKGLNSIDEILNNSADDRASAYQALFNTWRQTYNEKTAVTACKQAASHALSCLHKQGNLNSLKLHNRPAVLTLTNNNGENLHVTITAIKNDLATVFSNNKEYTVKLSELDKHWYGQFILLWQKPAHYSSSIVPGAKGNIINWLNTQLAKINDLPVPEKNVTRYNSTLIEKVKAFQLQHGLTADGIVGPVTIIHINTQADADTPSLISSQPVTLTKQG